MMLYSLGSYYCTVIYHVSKSTKVQVTMSRKADPCLYKMRFTLFLDSNSNCTQYPTDENSMINVFRFYKVFLAFSSFTLLHSQDSKDIRSVLY